MNRRLFALALVSSLAAGASPALAQATNPLVGRWTVEYERGRRIENGEPTPIMGTGELTIVQQGDSLIATIAPAPRPDAPPTPPSTVVGRQTPAGVVFVQKQSVQMNMNGERSTHEMLMTWTLQANGDALTGTLARELPAMNEPLPLTPVKGTRKTS